VRTAIELLDTHSMPTYKRWPVEIAGGRGCFVTDSKGRTYLDMVAGIAVAGLGHCHPAVTRAIANQAKTLVHVSNLYPTRPQALVAERLGTISGGKKSFFANSGAEAVECALKLARKWGRTHKNGDVTTIVCAEGGFHGRTFGALAATGQPAKRAPFEPLPAGFVHVPYGEVDALAEALGPEVCAVLLEPVQGEAGIVVPPPGYLGAARELCDKHGVLLILDEIQTGLGRTGAWFAAEHYGVDSDVTCLGKALASGLPMSACLARAEIADSFAPGDHATTFGGGPVPSAAALATLDVIESEDLCNRSAALGKRLLDGLRAIAPPGAEVRGLGLMVGVDFGREVARNVAERALEKGVLVNDATPTVVRLTPPLVIDETQISQALDVLEEVFGEV
jgi:acetylornithine/N-succinyldiaminopimelate aminotransferase